MKVWRRYTEQDKGDQEGQGRGRAVTFNRDSRVVLNGEVTYEQSLQGGEEVSLEIIWKKSGPCKVSLTARFSKF